MANRPYGPTGNRVWFSISPVAAAGHTSGVEIEAAAAGRGVIIFRIDNQPLFDIGFKQTDTEILDVARVVVTPTIVSDPDKPLTTVITTGRDSTGTVPIPPDYIFQRDTEGDLLLGQELFVPPGKFITVLELAVAVTMNLSMAFTEL